MIDIQLFKAVLEKQTRLIDETDFIPESVIAFFTSYRVSLIEQLFKQSTSKEQVHYKWESQCSTCSALVSHDTCKSEIFKFLTLFARSKTSKFDCWDAAKLQNYDCFQCVERRRLKEEQDKTEQAISFQAQSRSREETTSEFISNYLDSSKAWNEETNFYHAFKQVERLFSCSVNQEVVVQHIVAMPYNDFLNTPYWKCVAKEVYRRAKFLCSICGQTGQLNAHHRNYSIHGYEIEHVGELTCVCQSCHSIFHEAGVIA